MFFGLQQQPHKENIQNVKSKSSIKFSKKKTQKCIVKIRNLKNKIFDQ